MRTRWGGCNTASRCVWFNLELVKQPGHALDYLVVRELVHLLEGHHNVRFTELLGGYLPQWRQYRALLGQTPLGHSAWNE